jgi:hypothetical protein
MRTLLAVRERKTLTATPKWQSGKKMPRSAFPLSKSHSYPLGSSFDWCVCDAVAGENQYKLLVAFDPAKEQYRAWLGLVDGTDQALLARLEFHPSHKGWHLHVKVGMLAGVSRGVVKQPSNRDKSRDCDAPNSFKVTQLDALGIACKVFNVEVPVITGVEELQF